MKKIALAWGWTWWHITPLVSLYKYLWNENYVFFWIWENNSLEQKIAWENEIKFYGIRAGKLRRYFSLQTIIEPFKIISGIFQAIKILSEEKPDLIFSKWWFVSLPIAIAAYFLWIKLFLHESDSVPWLANKYVGKFASKIYLWFDVAKKYFDLRKTEVTWQILNPELFTDLVEKPENLHRTQLLIIWWSQWSKRIFEYILWNIDKLNNYEITIVLWSLNSNMKEQFKSYSNITTYDFIDQNVLKNIYQKTDIAITRAWATSLAELELFGVKMIIIPLKESANNHQYYNAISYEKKWNIMIEEWEFDKITPVLQENENYKKSTSVETSTYGVSSNERNVLEIIKTDLLR